MCVSSWNSAPQKVLKKESVEVPKHKTWSLRH